MVENSRLFRSPIANAVPVLMMHGVEDQMVPLDWGQGTATSLLLAEAEVRGSVCCIITLETDYIL